MAKVGDRIGPYELFGEPQRGGNGTVWCAKTDKGDHVAIKILHRLKDGADGRPRFQREVEVLRRLRDDPGILPLIECDLQATPAPWFSMPWAVPARDQLGEDSALEDVCRAIAAIAASLARFHETGLAHRDIKPENMFYWKDQWRLGDFGLVDFPDAPTLTADGKKLGSAYYIAPEMLGQAASSDGRRADIYSLGKSLWTLAAGQTFPLPGEHRPDERALTVSAYVAHPRANQLDGLVYRMTRVNPLVRPSAGEVAGELDAWIRMPAKPDQTEDWQEVLSSLRPVVGLQLRREEETNRKKDAACRCFGDLRIAADEIGAAISKETQLKGMVVPDAPAHFQYKLGAGRPSVVWQERHALAFNIHAPGGTTHYQFRIACLGQLITDDTMHLAAGFEVKYFPGGLLSKEIRQPAWHKAADALLDSPLAHTAVAEWGRPTRAFSQ